MGIEEMASGWPSTIKLLAGIVGAVAAVYTWILTRNAALYATFDTLYQDVLDKGLAKPHLRNPDNTSNYKAMFRGNDLVEYQTYAYMVFNVCETIADGLDFYEKRPMGFLKGLEWLIRHAFPVTADPEWLRVTWRPVLAAEKQLHGQWLEDQKPGVRFKKEFLDLMKGI